MPRARRSMPRYRSLPLHRWSLPSAATPGPTDPDPYADRLKKIDDHTFDVDRSLVRELVGGSMTKAGARILPQQGKDGTLSGLKVFGVNPTGLAGRLGLKNGDMIEG